MVKMITFRVGFLFAFSAAVVEKEKAGKGKRAKGRKGSKRSSKKGSKGSKKRSKGSKGSKEPRPKKEEPPKPDYVLEVGNPIGYVHVEYELIPNRDKQQFDVVCWKGVAKIVSKDDQIAYRVKIIEDKVWVPVFMEHYTNLLENEEVLKLHQHVIDFHMSTNKNKISQK